MKVYAKSFAITLSLAIIFSLFTLWLIDSWIKYPLFLFEILTIIVLYLIVDDYDIRITIKLSTVRNLRIGSAIDLFFIISALYLLTFNVLQVDGGLLQLILALLCTSLFPGYALLNIFGLTHHFSKLENTVLSYILSYVFTGFITFVSLPINQDIRAPVVLTSFVVVGLISAFKRERSEPSSAFKSLSKNIDFFVLLIAVTFYAISFYFLYPSFALLPGTDISRHYSYSIVLWRTPELYSAFQYLLSHLHESAFISLANPSLISAQTALVSLNLILPLVFYVMAKQHLENVDARLPSLATLFWVLFTNSFGGYAWIYLTNLKLSSTGQTQLQLLSATADKTYNGTVYGIFSLWYVPAVVSFILLMTAIFLLGKRELPKAKYFPLFSMLTAALYLTHVTEAVVFALFLAVYGLVSKNENYRINDAVKASIIGFILVIMVYYVFSLLTTRFIMSPFSPFMLMSIIGPIVALAISLTFRQYIRPKLPHIKTILKVNRNFLAKMLVLVLFIAYTVAILSWTSLIDSFHTWQVDTVGLVPWFMYPVMLGINSLLAIVALYYLIEHKEFYKTFAFFIAFMIFTFVAGRIISIVNLYFFDAGYWEKRFIWFIKIPLAALAPLPVIYVVDSLRKKRETSISAKKVLSLIIIGTIVLNGISTTFLNIEYWTEVTNNPATHPSPTEMEAISALKEILSKDPKAWLATVTSRSSAIFAAPADTLGLTQLLYTADRPEMALMLLYRLPTYDHPYVYMHTRDERQLSRYADGFLSKYLSILPIVFENSEVKIYNVSKLSPPQPNSDTVLVLPLDKSLYSNEESYIAYDMLSQGFYNYTVAYDMDNNIFNAKTLILAFDPPGKGILPTSYQDSFNQTLSSWATVKGSWQVINGGLYGGETGKYGEGIILSQVSAQNFTASFKVKPLTGDASALNYVSLIYSWVDSKNYRIADIMFGQDGYIYVHFRTIADGIEQVIPKWPGIKTDLRWEFGKEYNITVVVNGTLNQILINNKPYLSANLENIPGRVGLRYYRFYQAVFDDFTINYAVKLNLRATEDYINFLERGGKIVIFNINGYNLFGKGIFNLTNRTFNAEKIQGMNEALNLPAQIPMQKLSLNNSAVSIISNYIGLNGENPFIVRQNYGKGELFYVNIYPIAEAMRKAENPSTFYPILGKLLGDLNLSKLEGNFIPTLDGYVKAIDLNSDAKVETSSLIFPLRLAVKQVDIEAANGLTTLYNVTSIQIKGNSNLIVEAEDFTIENGQGFYTTLKLNSTFKVKPSTGSFNVKIATEKEEFQIGDVKKLSIIPRGSVSLFARTPEINASQVTFTEFYPFGQLQWRTRTYGQSLTVTGLTSFQIVLSDSYTILKNVKLGAYFTRNPPIVMFDELSTVPTAIFWTLLLLPFFLGVTLIYASKKHTTH